MDKRRDVVVKPGQIWSNGLYRYRIDIVGNNSYPSIDKYPRYCWATRLHDGFFNRFGTLTATDHIGGWTQDWYFESEAPEDQPAQTLRSGSHSSSSSVKEDSFDPEEDHLRSLWIKSLVPTGFCPCGINRLDCKFH